jgi:hypothetical protein
MGEEEKNERCHIIVKIDVDDIMDTNPENY